MIGVDDLGLGIDRPHHLVNAIQLLSADHIGFVDENDIGKLQLVDHQLNDRCLIMGLQPGLSLLDFHFIGMVLIQEYERIHHSDHRVQMRHVFEGFAVIHGEGECRGDGQRL